MRYIVCKLINDVYVPLDGLSLDDIAAAATLAVRRGEEPEEIFAALAVLD
jgi:hypothetical protein